METSSKDYIAPRLRSRSLDIRNDYRTAELTERMKHTFGFKLKSFKANTRGNYIQEAFITLNDLLSKTPDSMTLNVEISKNTPQFSIEWVFFLTNDDCRVSHDI